MAVKSNQDVLQKQIAKLENTILKQSEKIRTETEKLKANKTELSRLKTEALSDYIESEKIEFNDSFVRQMQLVKKLMLNGVSEKDLEEFFALTDGSDSKKAEDTALKESKEEKR